MSRNAAYTTLLTKTEYLPGALVLESSLQSVNAKYPLVVMVTPALPQDARAVLKKRGLKTIDIEPIRPADGTHKLTESDARFADTWTKLRAFELYDYERVVLLDSDTLVMKNMDELMDVDLPKDWIAAVHACACNPRRLPHYPADWIPANCAHTAVAHPTAPPVAITESSPRPYRLLNSGLVVLSPSVETAKALKHYLYTSPLVATFSFPDQDLLASFFEGRWKPLPWYYNALKTLRTIHGPLWSDDEVRFLHYILSDKPWQKRIEDRDMKDEHREVNKWWWGRFEKLSEEVRPIDPQGWELVLANVAR